MKYDNYSIFGIADYIQSKNIDDEHKGILTKIIGALFYFRDNYGNKSVVEIDPIIVIDDYVYELQKVTGRRIDIVMSPEEIANTFFAVDVE